MFHGSSGLHSHLLSMPRCSRGDVCESPSCFKLQSWLIIHTQEGHKAGQQTRIYDLLQRRITLLRKELPGGRVEKIKDSAQFTAFPPASILKQQITALYKRLKHWWTRALCGTIEKSSLLDAPCGSQNITCPAGSPSSGENMMPGTSGVYFKFNQGFAPVSTCVETGTSLHTGATPHSLARGPQMASVRHCKVRSSL